MSRNPAKKIIAAASRKRPVANIAAAQKFTTRPRNVRKFGLIPVAARAPTILSSSQRLPSPIHFVSIRQKSRGPRRGRSPPHHTILARAPQVSAMAFFRQPFSLSRQRCYTGHPQTHCLALFRRDFFYSLRSPP